MKIFTGSQIRKIDSYTIDNEPVRSVDLMERAAGKVFSWLTGRFDRSDKMVILAGPGNNGGDGLAVARMLADAGYHSEVFFIPGAGDTSADWKINRKRLEECGKVPFCTITGLEDFSIPEEGTVIVDAIFGTGLSRPAGDPAAGVIRKVNRMNSTVISIDIPSGLFPEDNSSNDPDSIIKADFTLSFQFPKLAFMFADNYKFTGEWHIMDIGLHPEAIENTSTPYLFTENSMVRSMLKVRHKFDHKGIYGHALLVAGSALKTGAAILAAKSCLRAGAGLVTCHLPGKSSTAMNAALPEAMVQVDANPDIITRVGNPDSFSAVAAGPGTGQAAETAEMISGLIQSCRKPMVLDADALNILSGQKDWLKKLPAGTILTPHPGEFARLAGETSDGYSRLQKQISLSRETNCIIVLKGAHTSVSLPDGRVFFNSTGNPGMATAGSGDVLTGIILSLLAQGYVPEQAAITGVYLHGLAGDLAADQTGMEALIAGDIIENIGNAYRKIKGEI
ncbi:MAG TPA: NAD(P)H-hydrate dehydratase [Bacteroidales bacterium]|nr:NAD(P)H-hydrate dehydratase [Bacteroidales bacterium]